MVVPDLQSRKLLAGFNLVERLGATSCRIGHTDDDDPVVWYVVASWVRPPFATAAGPHHETAAALSPDEAMGRLIELLVDGGRCVHCKRVTLLVTSVVPLGAPLPVDACRVLYNEADGRYDLSCGGGHG